MLIRNMLIAVGAVGALISAAVAEVMPANYEVAARGYVMERLATERGARVAIDGEPYPVIAEFDRIGRVDAWAVDIRLRSRSTRGNGFGRYQAMTVVFVNGEPVALEDDLARVDRRSRRTLASN